MDLLEQNPIAKVKVRRIDLLPNHLKYLEYFVLIGLGVMTLILIMGKRSPTTIFSCLFLLMVSEIAFFGSETYIVYENGIETSLSFIDWKDFEKIEWKKGKLYLYRKMTRIVLPDPNKAIYSLIRK